MDYEMAKRPETWLPLLAGLAWFGATADEGLLALLLAAVPAAPMITCTVGTLSFPGERRINRAGATGALLGLVFAALMLPFDPLTALLLAAITAAAAMAAGRLAWDDLEPPEGQHAPRADARTVAEVALDEAVLGVLSSALGVYAHGGQSRWGEELEAQLDWLRAGGWTESPLDFHESPPPMGPMAVANARSTGLDLEVVRYDSEFEPRSGAPGRERWLSYRANRSTEVRLVRHRDSADWLVCVHGLGMGRAPLDLRFLDAQWLHRRGVNLAFPVLPLHGPRQRALVSGTGFIDGDIAGTLHALTQATWDLRRLIAWLRSQGAARVGVYGLSLGGYVSALLAAVEDELDFVLAGVPATELAELMWFHASLRALALAEGHGITPERLSAALLPVAPLVLGPRVPRERRFLYGATADRFVPPRQVEALWRHWERPSMCWYPGSHLGFRLHDRVRAYVARSLDGCDFGREA